MATNLHDRLTKHKLDIETHRKGIQNAISAEERNAYRNKDFEKNAFGEFVKANSGKEYVELEHIDALNLPYHVLFVVSVKNAGKTTNIIYNRFNYYKNRGQKVVFGRCTPAEIDKAKGEYNRAVTSKDLRPDQINPFIIKKKQGAYVLLSKDHPKDPVEYGKVVDFRNCNVSSGGEHADYGAIIFDEIISWDTKNMINANHISAFDAFVSSVVRNKKDFKVYLLGNIQGTNSAILDAYDIKRDDNLRYINRGTEENPCYVLYININNIYTGGIQNQRGVVQQMSAASKAALFNNKVQTFAHNVIDPELFSCLAHYLAFLYMVGPLLYIFELRVLEEDGESYLAAKVKEYLPYVVTGGKVYTDSVCLANSYGGLTHSFSIEDIKKEIFNYITFDKMLFFDDLSRNLCSVVYDDVVKNSEFIY